MNKSMRFAMVCLVGTTLGLAAPAHAASDYLLEIDGVDGGPSTVVELASWSFGASNPTSVGSSGMSAGRMHKPKPVAEPAEPDSAATNLNTSRSNRIAASPDAGSDRTSNLNLSKSNRHGAPGQGNGTVTVVTAREAGSGMATGRMSCATGVHFPKATLSHRGERWALAEVVVASCDAHGMTLNYGSVTKLPPVAPSPESTIVIS